MIGHIAVGMDVIFLIVLVIFAGLYGFVIGRDRSVSILLSVYLAFAVVTNAPILFRLSEVLGIHRYPALRVAWFVGIFLLTFLVLWRSHILRGMAMQRGSWWESVLFSILQMGLAISVLLFLLPAELVSWLTPLLRAVFLSDLARTIWMITPIVGLVLLGRPKAEDLFLEE